MRKVTKPAVRCPICNNITEYEKSEDFCDQCGKRIPENKHSLRIGIHNDIGISTSAELCSWICVKNWLKANKKKLKRVWFISLPFPAFNEPNTDKGYCDSGKEFFKVFVDGESS
jgi:hypothetical protein